MFKKPVTVAVTHELKQEDKKFIDAKIDQVNSIIKETLITLAIGIPCAILFGLTANAIIDHVSDNSASSEQ